MQIRFLDSNVLLRVITNDVPALAREANTVLSQASFRSLVIDQAVLCEVCFILEYHEYTLNHAVIADSLLELFNTPSVITDSDAIEALKLYKTHPKLDFVDCLLYVKGGKSGVYTFDKALRKLLDT